LIKLLQEQPSSRHGVVVTWDPGDDGLSSKTKKKNEPCPYTFTANILNNKLNMLNVVRSNDMILGCPHDIAGFALLQRFLAAKLEVGVGRMTHCISNAHVWDNHFQAAWEILERNNNHKDIKLEAEKDWFDRAEKGDEELAKEIIDTLTKQYNPMPSIKGLEIVL
jgi:thymidylate synthase